MKRLHMLERYLPLTALLAFARAGGPVRTSGQGQTPAAAPKAAEPQKPWTAPRTPWGHPDLQGTYTSNDNVGVPVERPKSFGERALLTDAEFAERQKQAER